MKHAGPTIRRGSRVELHLRILLADGTEVLSSFGGAPLELVVGDGTLAPGLEHLLIGLHAGAREHFLADGSDLYGPRDQSKIHWLARSEFPAGLDLAYGQVIAFDTPGGQEVAGRLLEMDENRVQVDFNHPLSGRPLQIQAQILGTRDPTGR